MKQLIFSFFPAADWLDFSLIRQTLKYPHRHSLRYA
jgi:hypothetical protein